MATPITVNAIAAVSRLYPFFSGNFTLVNSSHFAKLFPNEARLAWCHSPGGPILVPLDDAVGRCIYFTGDYDRKITWLCRKLLRPGDVALDIGANLGVVALAMSRIVGPSGHVHCFEPNPQMQALLRQSIDRSVGKIILHEFALGSANTRMQLYVPSSNVGAGSLARSDNTAATFSCLVHKLDDIMPPNEVDIVRLIKLDVEGFENEVLLGAEKLIQASRPVIIMETNDATMEPFGAHPPVATLLTYGYCFFEIPKALFSMHVNKVSDLNIPGAPSHDVLAVPSERSAAIRKLLS
jgi:FkbM family methyltransferase